MDQVNSTFQRLSEDNKKIFLDFCTEKLVLLESGLEQKHVPKKYIPILVNYPEFIPVYQTLIRICKNRGFSTDIRHHPKQVLNIAFSKSGTTEMVDFYAVLVEQNIAKHPLKYDLEFVADTLENSNVREKFKRRFEVYSYFVRKFKLVVKCKDTSAFENEDFEKLKRGFETLDYEVLKDCECGDFTLKFFQGVVHGG